MVLSSVFMFVYFVGGKFTMIGFLRYRKLRLIVVSVVPTRGGTGALALGAKFYKPRFSKYSTFFVLLSRSKNIFQN